MLAITISLNVTFAVSVSAFKVSTLRSPEWKLTVVKLFAVTLLATTLSLVVMFELKESVSICTAVASVANTRPDGPLTVTVVANIDPAIRGFIILYIYFLLNSKCINFSPDLIDPKSYMTSSTRNMFSSAYN